MARVDSQGFKHSSFFSEANMRLLSRVEEEVDFFSIGRRVIVVYVERIQPDFYYQLLQPDIKIIVHIYNDSVKFTEVVET